MAPGDLTGPLHRSPAHPKLGTCGGRPGRYKWEHVTPADPDHMPPTRRLLHVLADRAQQQTALDEARRRADEAAAGLSAVEAA